MRRTSRFGRKRLALVSSCRRQARALYIRRRHVRPKARPQHKVPGPERRNPDSLFVPWGAGPRPADLFPVSQFSNAPVLQEQARPERDLRCVPANVVQCIRRAKVVLAHVLSVSAQDFRRPGQRVPAADLEGLRGVLVSAMFHEE